MISEKSIEVAEINNATCIKSYKTDHSPYTAPQGENSIISSKVFKLVIIRTQQNATMHNESEYKRKADSPGQNGQLYEKILKLSCRWGVWSVVHGNMRDK